MAAALHPATRRAAAAAGDCDSDLWTVWIAPRYRERGVAVERPRRVEAVDGRVGAMKPVGKEATADGEEGVEETPEWVIRLTTRRDIRVGRAARRAVKATSLACCYLTPDTGNAPSDASDRRRQDRNQGKPGRKAAPGRPAKKEYIFRNSFAVFMSEIEAGELDARDDMFQEGETFAEPERDTKLEPQLQTLQAYVELAETKHRRARTLRQQEWPAVVKFTEMDAGVEMLQDGETFAEPELDTKFEPDTLEPHIKLADTADHRARSPALVKDQAMSPDGTKRDKVVDEGGNKNKHLERRLRFCFAKDERKDRPVLVKTEKSDKSILKHVHGPDTVTVASEDAPRNPLLRADRRAFRRTTGGRGGPGRDGVGGGGGGDCDGGGGWDGSRSYRVGPGKTPVPRARCQGDLCRNPAKRYCSSCHFILCPGCGCHCEPTTLHYVLPEPILVGDCEVHHRLSDPFPDYPHVLVRGVRSLMHGWVDYTFSSVHDIFRIEGIGRDIPVLQCRLRDKGPFSWASYPLELVAGKVARADLFH